MMKFSVYIIYSEIKGKYYIGMTSLSLTERIRRHNSNHQGFTGSSNDWITIFYKEFEFKKEALICEKTIKSRGAKRFLGELNK